MCLSLSLSFLTYTRKIFVNDSGRMFYFFLLQHHGTTAAARNRQETEVINAEIISFLQVAYFVSFLNSSTDAAAIAVAVVAAASAASFCAVIDQANERKNDGRWCVGERSLAALYLMPPRLA